MLIQLMGNYTHTFDAKNRVFLPAKMRDFFDDKVILVPDFANKCVKMYSQDSFADFTERLSGLPELQEEIMNFKRTVFSNAFDTSPDSQGRILVPQALREYAGIEGKNVLIVGIDDHAELWNPETFAEYNKKFVQPDVIKALLPYGI